MVVSTSKTLLKIFQILSYFFWESKLHKFTNVIDMMKIAYYTVNSAYIC